MADRITRTNVESAIELLNGILENRNSMYRIMLRSYNDYCHIEKYDHDDLAKFGYRRCQYDALCAGNLRECNNHVRAMIAGIDLFTRDSSGLYTDND